MKCVAFVADGWGFGTTTLLACPASAMAGRCKRLLVGTSEASEVMSSSFDEVRIVEEFAAGAEDSARWVDALRDADAVVSAMNVWAIDAAGNLGVPSIYIDALTWMWPEPFGGRWRFGREVMINVSTLEAYLAETFPGVPEQVSTWGRVGRAGVSVIGPILGGLGTEASHRSGARVLVNVGGMASHYQDDPTRTAYIGLVAAALIRALDPADDAELVVAGGSAAMEEFSAAWSANGRQGKIGRLSRDAYLDALARSSLLVTAAGTQAMWEAAHRDIPTVLLPAQNVSQELAIQRLVGDVGTADISWSANAGIRVQDMPQPAGCEAIRSAIALAFGDQRSLDRIAALLRSEVEAARSREVRRPLLRADGLVDGASEVVDALQRVLRGVKDSWEPCESS